MSNVNRKAVKAATADKNTSSILGTFSGKCLDTNVFNNNDWRASREVFEVLMSSDEYKRAMQNRHYVGYAGHPEDSDCQDFEHACIVMTDMRLLDNGEVEGDFDLIDTKVGRIVKAFVDAGVKFGISIRGLGDITPDGEVDPNEFIFRGFDLVTFPAYNDCIPEFKAIAASTDAKKKAQYRKICASIDANLDGISSNEALLFIQEQLPENSDEFKKVQDRIDELSVDCEERATSEELVCECEDDLVADKLAAMTELYLDAAATIRELEKKVADLEVECVDIANESSEALDEAEAEIAKITIECRTLKRQQARLNRLTANQIEDSNNSIAEYQEKCERSNAQIQKLRANLSTARSELKQLKSDLNNMEASYNKQVRANTQLKDRISELSEEIKEGQKVIKSSNDLNLKYKMKIEANSEAISQRDSAIEDLESRLNETVIASNKFESEASNLGDKNEELLSRVEAAEEMVSSYQQAYANLYANALGVYLTNLPIDANTSVEDLTSMIKAGTSSANIGSNPNFLTEEDEDEDRLVGGVYDDDTDYTAGMVTL